jgi:hypothetical protein
MSNSSESGSPEPMQVIIMSGTDWDLIMTQAGSAIASGAGDPISLQNLN